VIRALYRKYVDQPRRHAIFSTNPRWVELNAEMERQFANADACSAEVLLSLWDIEANMVPHLPWILRTHRWDRWINLRVLHRDVVTLLQRGRRGFADPDIVDLDRYLSRVIAESVAALKALGNSRPPELTGEEWHHILDHIAIGITDPYRIPDGQRSEADRATALVHQDEALALLARWWRHLWD
jgi:hypothetical protein